MKTLRTLFLPAALLSVGHQTIFRVEAVSTLGEVCQVRYGEVGSDGDFKYFETGNGNIKCDNSNGASLVCIPEEDDGTGADIPGVCESKRCFEPMDDIEGKVTICHRTCSETNPWVRITIDGSAWADASCKHGQHTTEKCVGKDLSLWGENQQDYILKIHGTKADVAASFNGVTGDINGYWKHWEPACPAVRNGACCFFDGQYGYSCCGRPDIDPVMPDPTPAPTPAPVTATPAPVTPAPVTPAPIITPAPVTPSPTNAPVDTSTPAPNQEATPPSDCRRRHLQEETLEQKWNISEPTFDYTDLTFSLDFEISDFISNDDMVQYTMLEQSCNDAYVGSGMSDSKGTRVSIGNGKQRAPVNVVIDPFTISQDAQVYSEPPERINDQATANVDFCLRFSLHTPVSAGDLEGNYLEVIVRLFVDLTDGFVIDDITVEPLNRCEKTAQDAFQVEGYFCNEGTEAIAITETPVMTQGEIIKVCVRPVEEARQQFIRMRSLREFTWQLSDENSVSQVAIEDYAASRDGLTQMRCTQGYAICSFESILYATFFRGPGAVIGSGVADLQFGGEVSEASVSPQIARRTLREAIPESATTRSPAGDYWHRHVQENQENDIGASVAFDMEMSIRPVNSYGASAARGTTAMDRLVIGTMLMALVPVVFGGAVL